MFVFADIGEALMNNYGCEDSCTNMFVIAVSDIDETLVNNCGCEDTCTNMFVDHDNKTYECSCNDTGYELGRNEHSCEGEFFYYFFLSMHLTF